MSTIEKIIQNRRIGWVPMYVRLNSGQVAEWKEVRNLHTSNYVVLCWRLRMKGE